MKIYNYDIVLQEVPDEISLCITVCGCNNKCDGCHSPHIWGSDSGKDFDFLDFVNLIQEYKNYITCVLFMGGEWDEKLNSMLSYAKNEGLKTCLYTGQNDISSKLKLNLDFLKTGKWIKELGGLNSKTTNQIFQNVKTGEHLNYKFIK